MAWASTRRGAITPLIVLLLIGMFVESGFTPAALTYLAEIAEEQAQDRGSVMGVYSVLLSVGQLAGTALAGPFAAAAGFNGLITLTGLLTPDRPVHRPAAGSSRTPRRRRRQPPRHPVA